jgi:hypothetical protein
MSKTSKNALRDRAEREAHKIVSLLDQAKTMALRVDLVGATDALRQARQGIVQTCLQYESKLWELEAALSRAKASATLAERQLQSMQHFSKTSGAEAAPGAAADA